MEPFAEWLPDRPDFANPGSVNINNVIPYASHYKPLRDITAVTDALTATPQGAISLQDSNGTVKVYAGDATKLYRLTSGTTWTDASGASAPYATPNDGSWGFVQFGDTVIAVNGADSPQKIAATAGTTFADLGGTPPTGKYIAVVRNFVVIGNLTGFPSRIHWSAFENAEGWTVGTDQSDYQDFPDSGWVQAIIGGEDGYVFCEHAIYRMSATGDDFVFQFDKIEESRGTAAPKSVVKVGQSIFFLSYDGFYMMGAGGGSQPIGIEKVDKTFFADLNETYIYRVSAASDPINKMIMWSYPSVNSTDGSPDKVIMYNWGTQQWSRGDLAAELLFSYMATGVTLEGLDAINSSIDALSFSLDSRVWMGGALSLGAFNTSNQMGTLAGNTLAATLETKEAQLNPEGRAHVWEVSPFTDTTSATVKIGTRERQGDSVSYSSAYSQETSGRCPARDQGRFHRAKVEIPAATSWTEAQGVDFKFKPVGMR